MADADESSSDETKDEPGLKDDFDDESALRKVLFDLSASKSGLTGEVSSPMKRRRSRHASLSGGQGTVCVPMIAGLTERQADVFSLFDPEGSGRVRPEEIRSAAVNSGLEREFPEVWQLMTSLDSHDSVDFEERDDRTRMLCTAFSFTNDYVQQQSTRSHLAILEMTSSSSDHPGLPVVLGRTNPPTHSHKSDKTGDELPIEAEPTEVQDGEATCGQVNIAVNMSRGMPWFRRAKDPGWFVVGNRRVVERLNRDWLDKKSLQQLCEDVNELLCCCDSMGCLVTLKHQSSDCSCEDITRLGEHLQLFEDEPFVLCKNEKYCGFCFFLVTAALVIVTVAWGALHKHQSNGMMVACGVLLAITTMCCFCMNFRRRRMMDWEVPHGEIKRFAARWGKKYGFHLTFELHFDGPSYFILRPKRQASKESTDNDLQPEQQV
eukprot:symbB.v1.2.008524.t1/scaffold527.1/size293072/22